LTLCHRSPRRLIEWAQHVKGTRIERTATLHNAETMPLKVSPLCSNLEETGVRQVEWQTLSPGCAIPRVCQRRKFSFFLEPTDPGRSCAQLERNH
jgi:hypothetical protein